MATRKRKSTPKRGESAVVPVDLDDFALTDYEEELAPYVERDAQAVGGGGGWSFLSTRGGAFALGEIDLGTELDVVVVGAMRENAYYPDAYDAANPSGPSCFALNLTGDSEEMGPPADLPTKENDRCATCKKNAFGSSDTGRGKACRNSVRLALLPADLKNLSPDYFAKIDGALLRLPPTSLTKFDAYVKILTSRGVPLFLTLARLLIESDPRHQFHVILQPNGGLPGVPMKNALRARADEAIDQLRRLPELTLDAPKAGPRRRKVSKRKVGKKRGRSKKETPKRRGAR